MLGMLKPMLEYRCVYMDKGWPYTGRSLCRTHSPSFDLKLAVAISTACARRHRRPVSKSVPDSCMDFRLVLPSASPHCAWSSLSVMESGALQNIQGQIALTSARPSKDTRLSHPSIQ